MPLNSWYCVVIEMTSLIKEILYTLTLPNIAAKNSLTMDPALHFSQHLGLFQ